MQGRCFAHYQREEGFSLLEGMLSAVILGTGLLAMSAMQSIALVKNVDANEMTRVTSVASDMMERVYFNRRNAVSYNGIDTQNSSTCQRRLSYLASSPHEHSTPNCARAGVSGS